MKSRRTILAGAAAAIALAASPGATAQDYPSRPITILIGISPGGITDVTTRIYAEAVSKSLGQRIVIENRTGAGGAVAATAVQNAAPDGYTLLAFLGSQHCAVPALQKVAFDPVKGFQPITLLFNLVTFIAVPADSPANTMNELLALGKSKPEGLTFGSPGLGTPSHLLAARIARATSTPTQYVHYRGGSPMLADLVTGRVDFALPTFTVAKAYLEDRKLKIFRHRRRDALAGHAECAHPLRGRPRQRDRCELGRSRRTGRHTCQHRPTAERSVHPGGERPRSQAAA